MLFFWTCDDDIWSVLLFVFCWCIVRQATHRQTIKTCNIILLLFSLCALMYTTRWCFSFHFFVSFFIQYLLTSCSHIHPVVNIFIQIWFFFHFIFYTLTVHRRRVLMNTQLKMNTHKMIVLLLCENCIPVQALIDKQLVCNANWPQSIVLFTTSKIRLKCARCVVHLIICNWHDFYEL